VADHAAFDFCFVLIHEGALFFGVALVADRVPRRVGAELLGTFATMRIVAVVALKQALRNAMMEGTSKLGPDVLVANVAKPRRLGPHEELSFCGVVRRVTIDAGDTIGEVHGAFVIAVLFCVLVAAQAAGAGLLGSRILKGEDFCFVAAAVDVILAWAVAGFAAMPLDAFVGIEFGVHGRDKVRGLLEAGVNLVVTGFAGVRADIEGGVSRSVVSSDLVCRLGLLCRVSLVACLECAD